MHTFRRFVAFVLLACLFASPAFAQSYTYSVYIDSDVNSATGCSVTLPNGTFSGVESVLTATVATGSPPQVTSVTRSTCSGSTFGAPVAEGSGAVSVGVGIGGTTAIELTDAVSQLVPPGTQTARIYVVARSATGDDVLLATVGAAPIVVLLQQNDNGLLSTPLFSIPALILLVLCLLAFGSRAVRKRLMRPLLLGLVLFSGISGAMIFPWSGIQPIATDPAGDTTSGEDAIDLRYFFVAVNFGNVYFRCDVTGGLTTSPPTAAADSYAASVGAALSVPAPGLLANDLRGSPQATLISFGGGSVGGPVTGHAVGTSAPLGASGSTLTVNAAGDIALTAPTTAGTYTFQYRLSNSQGTSDGTVTIQVTQAPAITSGANATFTVGAAGTFPVTTVGTPVAAIVRGGVALPSGVTFIDNGNGTGTLAGTPATGTGGSYAITFTPSNSVGTGTAQNFTLTVNEAPKITSANNAAFTVGAAGTFTVTTSGTPAPSIALGGTALPSGVTFVDNGNGTGTLAGTPAVATGGAYTITFTPNNIAGTGPVQSFTLTVNQGPAITSAANATFTVGTAGTFTVTTSGNPAPSIARGGAGLPGGVTFVDNGNGTGTLAGTPAAGAGGTYAITFTPSNTAGTGTAQNFTFTVNEAPKITSANNATFTVGIAGTFTVTTSGTPAPSIARGGVALPSGVNFVDNGNGTGTLSGTPAAATGGTYAITFTPTNLVGSGPVQTFTLTVDQAPQFITPNAITFVVGQANVFTVATTGFPNAALTAGGTLPSGVVFTDNGDGTASLAGNPAAGTYTASPYALTFAAANGTLPNASQTFSLTVVQSSNASPDSYTIVHDSILTTTALTGVLANDTGSSLTVSQVTGMSSCAPNCTVATAHGSVTMNTDGSFTYTPAANFAGTDTFNYTANSPLPPNNSPGSVTITVTNVAPIVDLNGAAAGIDFSVNFTEGGGPVGVVDTLNLSVVDSDSANLASATVTLTNLLDTGAETLSVTCSDVLPGCSGAIQFADVVYDGTTGVLSITRIAPLADYQTLLRTLKYNDSSQNPDTMARGITVAINDQIVDNAPLANVTVTMTSVNTAPTVTAPATALVSANPGTFVFTGVNAINVADVDGGANPEVVTLTATHGTISALGSTAGLTVNGLGTTTVTLTGPLSNLNTALSGATFAPDVGFSGTAATVAVNINDQGYSLGGTTQGTVQQANASVAITVDAPPQVVSTTPVNNATSVLPSTTIVFNFDKAVNASATGFTLSCNASAVAFTSVPALPSSGAGSATFTLTPGAPLPAGASCVATAVAAQVKDTTAVQTPMAADVAISFTINTLPSVQTVTPANGATAQPLSSTVTITFSESVNVTGSAFKLECPVGTPVGFTVTPASPATTFVLQPTANLPATTTCTVTVVATQVTDVDAGQQMASNFTSTFTTATPPAISGGAAASATFTIGLPNSYAISTTGVPAVNNITLGGAPLPLGTVFNYVGGANSASLTAAAGALNATQVGTTNGITFTASNGILPDATQTLALTIQCPAMVVSGSLPNGLFGQAYGPQAFTVTGGNGSTISWTIPSGIVAGLSINPGTGVVSGTPTNTVANSTVTILATDVYGCSAGKTFTGATAFTVAPVANPETYNKVVGNTQFVITGTTSAPVTPYVDGGLSFGFNKLVANDQGPGPLTVSPAGVAVGTANGGSVTIQADGSFNFTPKPGDTAASDTFTYSIIDGNGVSSAPTTVTMTFSGGRVWYVNGAAGVNGSGVSSSPFNTLASASTAHLAGVNPITGDVIFVESGGAPTATPGAITLKAFATLWGQGTTLPTNGATIPSLSIAIQNTAATSKPVLNGTVTLAGSGTTVSSLDINTVGVQGLTNTGAPTGVTVTNNVGVSTSGSTAVSLSNLTGTLSFRSVSVNGTTPPNGISLSGTGGSFTVNGDGTPVANGSGGTIANTAGAGILLSNAAGVSLRQMNITSAHASGIDASLAGTVLSANLMNITNSGIAATDNGVTLTNVGSVNLTSSTVSGSKNDGVHLLQSNGTLAASTLYGSAFSGHATGYGVHVQTSGAGTIAGLAIGGAGQSNAFNNNNIGVSIEQAVTTAATNGNITFAVQNNTFSNNAANNTFSHAINVESNGVHSTGGTITGQIENNTIGTQNTKDSGSAIGDGVRADIEGGAHGVLTISGNTLREVPNAFGFEIRGVGGPGGLGGLNVKLTGNTVVDPTGTNTDIGCGAAAPCPLSSVYIAADNANFAGGAQNVCAIVSGNTAYDPQAAWAQGAGQFAYQLDQLSAGLSAFNLGGTNPNAVTEINATNTVNTNTAVTNGTVNIVTVASCGVFPP